MPRKKGSQPLNIRQKARILAIQTKRSANLASRRVREARIISAGTLGAEEPGLVIAHFGLNAEVEDAQGERFRCAVREATPEDPVCGDRVIWQRAGDQQGVITAILPRTTVLRRPGPLGQLQTVAAGVDRLFMVTTASFVNPGLLDRYLVAAAMAGMEPIIVVNKMDLSVSDALAGLEAVLAPYRAMGYPVLMVSVATGKGLPELEAHLRGQVSIFVGQSGVGKSSLIARWITASAIKIRAVNAETGKGRQTTTVARLYHLPAGGSLIDSPGIRAFGLYGLSAEKVVGYFPDIITFLGGCRFSDCSHHHEPACAVQAGVAAGAIYPARLASLHRIMASLPSDRPGASWKK